MKDSKNILNHISTDLLEEYNMKSLNDVSDVLNNLKSSIIQAMLDGELENHLKYPKNSKEEKTTDNRRNGYSSKNKKVRTKEGVITVNMPRDRDGSFEPIIVSKKQRVISGDELDDAIIAMYAKGMTQRDISELIKKTYKIDLSTEFISNIINQVSIAVEKWVNRPLKAFYPFLYVDCLYVNIKDDLISVKRPVYVILGIDITGTKDVVGIWIGDSNSEGAYFWRGIFENLKERGVEDILFTSLDGLKGLPETINEVFPETTIQRCIVHLTRNLYGICPKKEANEIIRDFKKIYTSSSLEQAKLELENFKEKYKDKKNIIKKVEDDMQYIEPLFEVPSEIRKIIYTTNAIESVNSALRKVTRGKGSFPSKESIMKVLFLRVQDLETKWSKGISKWNIVLTQLINIYGERVTKYIEI